jgi:CDP-glycerol glycerophosphotransferase (TagB/SpsB family)
MMRELRDFNVIVKPHVNILKYRPGQILKVYINKKKNCYIFPRSINILPFMAISDLMVTDISSVAQEYLAFDKPIVFLHPKPGNGIPEEHTWMWRCGDVVTDKRDIGRVVYENLSNPLKYESERVKAKSNIFMDFDGRSAKRFREALEQISFRRMRY